ncbi:MAG: amino acid permease [Crocinitomicaceae bacterium]|nr:amino acid permease [Crocinitomicaceae bacterium]
MGTLPVFMTAISTILGAILFLRFGYAVANVGLIGALAIILIGHLVTIPTAMAVAEIATNSKVEGGGAYYMISRSFGLNIGAAIGIALFLSQAISVAFYVIAFAVSFQPLGDLIFQSFGIYISDTLAGLVFMVLLSALMLTKGADIGVKALYLVVAILTVSLAMFFLGGTYSEPSYDVTETIRNPDDFFYVFTIIFPAFTGIAAGLGLSGDLKNPKVSIPNGTMWATIAGIVVYVAVAFKLFYSASLDDLGNTNHLIMGKIAIWEPIIPIGLGCAAISSALGSIMIAPRTLQALGVDEVFPEKLSVWFSKGKGKFNEPFNSTILTCLIGFFFIAIGDIDFVAQIISMFFMVTYGAICLISFLEHFAADPSYRPTFRSKWYFSLFGAILCFYLMFKMNTPYAILSILIMGGIYWWATKVGNTDRDVAKLLRGVLFQLNREIMVYIQKRSASKEEGWRPFIICVSSQTFNRISALNLTRWLSQRHGFGTYIHFIEGFLDKKTYRYSQITQRRLVSLIRGTNSKVYLDTIVSPSYTSAIAQSIQLSGVSGRGNNLIIFEFPEGENEHLEEVVKNYNLLHATNFDVCVLKSTLKGFGRHQSIHVWISARDVENSNMMILMAYIINGHSEWRGSEIKIFSGYMEGELNVKTERLLNVIESGRLPISKKNIELIPQEGELIGSIIEQKSADADLTILGYSSELLEEKGISIFEEFSGLGNTLFVSAFKEKEIE